MDAWGLAIKMAALIELPFLGNLNSFLHVLFFERGTKFRTNVIHAGIESFHHDETEEFAGIRDDNAVRIVWVILDGARKAQSHHFLHERTVEIDTMNFTEVLARKAVRE